MLAPARPLPPADTRNTRGLTTCWGGGGGLQLQVHREEPGVGNYPEHGHLAPPPPGASLRGRCPQHPSAVEKLVESAKGAVRARSEGPAAPKCRQHRPPEPPARASGANPASFRACPRFPRAFTKPSLQRRRRLRGPRGDSPLPLPPRHFPVPTAPHTSEPRETLPVAPGPPPVPSRTGTQVP